MRLLRVRKPRLQLCFLLATTSVILSGCSSCNNIVERRDVRPLVMRDVPAQRLAFRLEADAGLPADVKVDENNDKIPEIQNDFNTRRKDDALLRTVKSPDGQRALALYGTADDPTEVFRIDLYSSDGKFLRNLTPPELAGAFPETATWSPDGNFITFIAHKSTQPTPSPTPLDEVPVVPSASPDASAQPSAAPSIAPVFAPVAVFNTEQIYICNRDGYELHPLTTREGLIYFYFSWAPDNHALAALACKEDEWNLREREAKLPAGRPRLLTPDGIERLLDDQMTEALPVWSPDASKVATAFDTDVGIYDAATSKPTQSRLPLRDPLLAASHAYEQKAAGNATGQPASTMDEAPPSFNPIVRLTWPTPEHLYLKTAYVRLLPSETINTFQRWHLVVLSPQAAILK